MEETLGKRIVAMRKKQKLTQDQLADQLGVTAQAVSKWENDQSCPDITMLPKLAEIFGCATDTLLGIETTQKVHEAEVITEEDSVKEDGLHITRGGFELKLEHGGRKGAIGFALLVLAVGSLYLAAQLLSWDISFWSILWPTTILVFGLFGSMPLFSFGSLGCIGFGAYFLLDNLNILPFKLGWKPALPIALLLLGTSILIKALRKPKAAHPASKASGDADSFNSYFHADENSFTCDSSFGSSKHRVELPELQYGSINTAFGETIIDLSGAETISGNCTIEVNLSFGECTLLVPNRYQVDLVKNASFATINLKGEPAPVSDGSIKVIANTSFGNVTVYYI